MSTTNMAAASRLLFDQFPRLCVHDELKRVRQFAVDVTLDPDTANPRLILSDDGKQVSHGDLTQNLPENPKRFYCCSVMGKQGFSSGRHYFEVQVKGKTTWVVGVAKESIDRTGQTTPTPKNGCWIMRLTTANRHEVIGSYIYISQKLRPQKVGVFVDYEEGLVSFYDADAAVLFFSFTGCNFTEKLYPYFNPNINGGGKNSTPLIICPVNHTD